MAEKHTRDRETPLPRGEDVTALGLLTSVGDSEHGGGRPQTIERLFMRLRIFWFFFMALPILFGAGLVAVIVGWLVRTVAGVGAASESAATIVATVAFVGALVVLVWASARGFERLTRRYRAWLAERAATEAEGARRQPHRPSTGPSRATLSELDARFAPPPTPGEAAQRAARTSSRKASDLGERSSE